MADVRVQNPVKIVDPTDDSRAAAVSAAGNLAVEVAVFSAASVDVIGTVAPSGVSPGDPVMIGGEAVDVDDSAPPTRVDAESDVTRLATDFDGQLFVRPHGAQVWSFHEDSSSQLTDSVVHAAPGAGLSLFVTDIVFSTGAATALDILFEEVAATVLGPWYLEAILGRGLSLHFMTPKKITANVALTVSTSAAVLHSIDVTGYIGQG